MKPHQAHQLATLITTARQALGMSSRELAERSGVGRSTVQRLERAQTDSVKPENLVGLSDALGVPLSELHLAAGIAPAKELPTFRPYLRSKYPRLPAAMQKELESSFQRMATKYGYDPAGPQPGEDE